MLRTPRNLELHVSEVKQIAKAALKSYHEAGGRGKLSDELDVHVMSLSMIFNTLIIDEPTTIARLAQLSNLRRVPTRERASRDRLISEKLNGLIDEFSCIQIAVEELEEEEESKAYEAKLEAKLAREYTNMC